MSAAPTSDVWAELAWRGSVHQVTDPGLGARLATERFTAYVGFDATADSLHVGHLMGMVALAHLQRAGHRPIALVGGATALIGDPSGKESERPLLTADRIDANAVSIGHQLEAFVDFGPSQAGGLRVNNGNWLRELGLVGFLRDVGKHVTVNTMIAKESVRARLTEREQGISYAEFSYMLLQAYDYLHLFDTFGCRLQAGGSDQWGNITAGIDLVRRARGSEVHGFTWPLLTKADGTKFAKTEAGAVWLDPGRTSPYQFFQFWLQVDDADVVGYLRMLTFLGRDEIAELETQVATAPHSRQAQRELARQLTTAVHGPEAARRAETAAEALFSGELASLDEHTLLDVFAEAESSVHPRGELDAGVGLVDLLVATGLDTSRSAARSTIAGGGAYVNDRRVTDVDHRLGPADVLAGAYVVLRKGKRRYHLVRLA
ncbi:MAG: tyrosine--tRNA ligase [Acidimicrobiales bacterium]|nr:MAG: tyrosine--tRNA ligase [Acidimicrobiales bacterium]